MVTPPRRLTVIVVVSLAVLTAGTWLGRDLISGSAGGPSTVASGPAPGGVPEQRAASPARSSSPTPEPASAPAAGSAAGVAAPPTASTPSATPSGAGSGGSSEGALPPVPTFPIAPEIVRTATVDLRVAGGTVSTRLADIAAVAAADGGYVESSSLSGGTARTSPATGAIVIRVLDADFDQAVAGLGQLGTVTGQQIQGKDVTDEVAANAASLQVLQDQVNLLQTKLAQASDIDTFLQIQDQLFPVEQQLQQLQNEQAVLEGSAALATVTAQLTAPGAPVTTAPVPAKTDAAATAWRYLRHNSLAVLDGLAVGAGWLLPVLPLGGAVWLGATWYRRRRRRAVSPA